MGVHAKELRIGNLVWTKSKPTSINQNNEVLTIVCMVMVEDCDEYTAIPLTEDWLVKFGFDKRISGAEWHFAKRIQGSKEFILNMDFVLCDIDLHVKVIHVHQLQNLFHILCGEDLTLNEA